MLTMKNEKKPETNDNLKKNMLLKTKKDEHKKKCHIRKENMNK